MKSFLVSFPKSDETLALYYALQEAGIPCTITATGDLETIKVQPEQMSRDEKTHGEHIAKIKGFIAGWSACYYREALPNDDPLRVERMGHGKPKGYTPTKTLPDDSLTIHLKGGTMIPPLATSNKIPL